MEFETSLTNVEIFNFQRVLDDAHVNRAVNNPGMIRHVLDDRLRRSPETEMESRCVILRLHLFCD